MYKSRLALVVLSILVLSSVAAAPQVGVQDVAQNRTAQDSPLATPGTIRGYVFRDSNRNGVFDADEEGIPNVFVTVSYEDYQATYYTGTGDASPQAGQGLPAPAPGPGSYGPTPLPSGFWTVTLHVPDGYQATTASELEVFVPQGDAATGVNFGIYGSGPIAYSAGTGIGMGGGAGAATLPQTGGGGQSPTVHLIALLVALAGLVALVGTPWCVAQARQVRARWW